MGVFKNEVGRPSNETIKKRNLLKVVCFILVVIILLLAAYIVNDKLNIVNTKNKTTTTKIDDAVTTDTSEKKYMNFVYLHENGNSMMVLYSNGNYLLVRNQSEYGYGTYKIENNKLMIKYHLMDDSIDEMIIDIDDNYQIENYNKAHFTK